MISTLCVFYRPIGCNDEASTDEEQGEKILYYYPEDTALSRQLTRLTMVEGLIEFSSRFSSTALETVVMEKQTWAFLQCEPDLWIVGATDNQPADATANEDHRRPNGTAFVDTLMKLYRLYCLFRGNILDSIRGVNDLGLERIRLVQEERKIIRKLEIKLRQEEADLIVLSRKQSEGAVNQITHPAWQWVAPTYTFETSKPLSALKSIEIDPSYRMPDLNRSNNKLEIPN
jgi:hypothetical protein